jgi:hypothetical protein
MFSPSLSAYRIGDSGPEAADSSGSWVVGTSMNRYPRPCTVRMIRWVVPSSPMARLACLILLLMAVSLTNRSPQTWSISSSVVTTRS